MAVASRVDLVVDFSRLADGAELFLVNCQEQTDGRGPTGKILPLAQGTPVLKFIVDGTIDTKGDPSRIPDRFLDQLQWEREIEDDSVTHAVDS